MINIMLEILKEIHACIFTSTQEIKFKKNDFQQTIIMALYGSIIESADSCIHLYTHSKYIAIPVIARNMFEALMDLKNLIDDPNYTKNMLASYYEQTSKICNPKYFKKSKTNTININDIKVFQKDTSEKLKLLQKDNFRPLNVFDKFYKADLDSVYTLYRHLCQDSHNNLSALENRHIIKDDGILKVIYYKNRTDSDKLMLLHYIYGVLRVAFQHVQLYFKLEDTIYTNEVVKYCFAFDEVRDKFTKETT